MFYLHGYKENLEETKNEKQYAFYKKLSDFIIKEGSKSTLSYPNECIPAGYTYLGQFIAHDISINNNLSSRSKPILQLDAIYGFGPEISSYLYELDLSENEKTFNRVWFRIWKAKLLDNQVLYDVPRLMGNDFPLIADVRNDENFIVSQLHVAFLRFHNALAYKLKEENQDWDAKMLFTETRKQVIYYYQHLLIHDYLKKLVGRKLVEDLLEDNSNFLLYNPTRPSVLKKEFSIAAFRLGHSQVRERYKLSDFALNVGLFDPSSDPNLRGFQRVLNRNIDWKFFFKLKTADTEPQPSNRMDQHIAESLTKLPFFKNEEDNLIMRNFRRGRKIKIGALLEKAKLDPFGHHYTKMGDSLLKTYLVSKNIKPENLPAWLYFLLESEIQKEGKMMGCLGGRIVAEQIIWILKKDKDSILNKSFKIDSGFDMDDFLNHRFSSKELIT